jgi:hypothetical protein
MAASAGRTSWRRRLAAALITPGMVLAGLAAAPPAAAQAASGAGAWVPPRTGAVVADAAAARPVADGGLAGHRQAAPHVPLVDLSAVVEQPGSYFVAEYLDVCGDADGSPVDLRRSLVAEHLTDRHFVFVAESCEPFTRDDVGPDGLLWSLVLPGSTSVDFLVWLFQDEDDALSIIVVDGPSGQPTWYGVASQSDDGHSVFGAFPGDALDGHRDFFFALDSWDPQGRRDFLPELHEDLVRYPASCLTYLATTAVVTAHPGRFPQMVAAAERAGWRIGARAPQIGMVEVRGVPAGALGRLAGLPGVARVRRPAPVERHVTVPDAPLYPDQWALPMVQAPAAWERTTGSGLAVAVIDDGVDATRTDLAGRVLAGWDARWDVELPAGVSSDRGGHGTAVTGVLAAQGDNGHGMAGVDWDARIIPYRVFDAAGCGTTSALAASIVAAADAAAAVINVSLGSFADDPAVGAAVQYATGQGSLIVASAGNTGHLGNEVFYPAAYDAVVGVGAATRDGQVAFYSTTGAQVHLVAPGGDASGTVEDDVLSLGERRGFAPVAGTSIAAPHVAGAALLFRSLNPSASPADVAAALAATAGDGGQRTDAAGWGLLDSAALVQAALPGAVAGRVTGAGGAIEGATVTVEGTDRSAETDAAGAYLIEGVAAGTHTLTATADGHRSQSLEEVEVEAGQTTTVDFTLEPAAPEAVVDPIALDFGPRRVGETSERTVTLSNDGDATLHVHEVTLTAAGGFALVEGACQDPLEPGASCHITVVFTPPDRGVFDGTLAVTSDGGGLQVPLGGTGAEPPGVPADVQASAGNAQATVSWSAPADDGGTPITDYRVTANSASQEPQTRSVGDAQTSFVFTGLTNGTEYTFTIAAVNAVGVGPASEASGPVTPTAPPPPADGGGGTPPPEEDQDDEDGAASAPSSVSRAAAAGETVSTPDGFGASADEPVGVAVTTPNPGTVTIAWSGPSDHPPSGFSLLGRAFDVTAPPATAGDPLVLRFRVHASLLASMVDPAQLAVLRDGEPAGECPGAAVADPDPCIRSRALDGDGWLLTVLTSQSSVWQVALAAADDTRDAAPTLPAPTACDASSGPAGFTDVPADNVHAAAVDCVAWYGIAHGLSATSYHPAGQVTRAQMASFLARLIEAVGIELAASGERFTDTAGSVHAERINQLAEAGIVLGVGGGRYSPDAAVSRSQLAAFLARTHEFVTGQLLVAGPHPFTDVAANTHEEAIAQAYTAGLAAGRTATTYEPAGQVRRDQMASFLARTLDSLHRAGHQATPR